MTKRAYRIWDKTHKTMLYPQDMAKMGVFLTAAGDPVQYKGFGRFAALQNVVVLWATGLKTLDGQEMWQDDVVDVDIATEFGSLVKARGVMKWDWLNGMWQIHIPNPPTLAPHGSFPVAGTRVAGNLYQHPKLLEANGN